jgi:hypothetical protein
MAATTNGSSQAENHTAIRPASQIAPVVLTKTAGAAGAPVQLGTAVRKNPASTAIA